MRIGAVILVLLGAAVVTAQTAAKWVHLGKGNRLEYATTPKGDRVMDFSHAGYKGGGVGLPTARVVRTIGPVEGDNTAQIQAAIDSVATLAPGADGLRGAVLLKTGEYQVSGTVVIQMSGVVLRG